MATNYKSMTAASGLNDIFAKANWRAFTAYPDKMPTCVNVQYRSEKYGCTRSVSCDAVNIARWLNDNLLKPGARADFTAILDRKPERPEPPMQQDLFPELLAPVAARSMGD